MQLFSRKGTLVQILFKELLVAFCNVFHSKVMGDGHLVLHGLGDRAFRDSTVVAKAIGLAGKNVHVARKGRTLHDGKLQNNRAHAKGCEAFHCHGEVCAIPVHLAYDKEGREIGLAHMVPEALCQGTHAVHCVYDKENAVHALEQILEISGEVPVSGNVQQEVAVLVPEEGSHCRLNGTAAADFFRLVVEAGGSFLDGAHPGDGAGIKEQHFCKGGLAAAARTHNGV